MQFFLDEAGPFDTPGSEDTHKAAVVVSVAVPDQVAPYLKERFSQFLKSQENARATLGEIKGRAIDQDGCRAFCRMLAGFPYIIVTPVTLDLSHLAQYDHGAFMEQMTGRFSEISALARHQRLRDELDLLSRRVVNLSYAQFLRLYSIAHCIRDSLQNTIIFVPCNGDDDPWQAVRVEIDRVQVRKDAREELIMANMLLGWLTGWSRSDPFVLVDEIHTTSHPFVGRYDTPNGIDLGKIFRGNVHWVDSRESWGVQIADIAATIVYQAVKDLDDRHGAVTTCAGLMQMSRYRSGHSLGLFTPTGKKMPLAVQQKYLTLVGMLEGSRHR